MLETGILEIQTFILSDTQEQLISYKQTFKHRLRTDGNRKRDKEFRFELALGQRIPKGKFFVFLFLNTTKTQENYKR